MSITHLIIQDEERKKQDRVDNRLPAQIPALDRSRMPFPTQPGQKKPGRGVVIISNGYDDDDDEEPKSSSVVVVNNDGYKLD